MTLFDQARRCCSSCPRETVQVESQSQLGLLLLDARTLHPTLVAFG